MAARSTLVSTLRWAFQRAISLLEAPWRGGAGLNLGAPRLAFETWDFDHADGSWSDYIYASGQRIARADSYDERIHIEGTSTVAGSYAGWYLPLATYVIRSGDKISWRSRSAPEEASAVKRKSDHSAVAATSWGISRPLQAVMLHAFADLCVILRMIMSFIMRWRGRESMAFELFTGILTKLACGLEASVTN